MILLFLENDLRGPFPSDEIDPSDSGSVIDRRLFAPDHINRRSADMGKERVQNRVMALFLASAALDIGINQIVVGCGELIPTVTSAAPNTAALGCSLFGGAERGYAAKLPAAYVYGIIRSLTSTVGPASLNQQSRRHIYLFPASTSAGPENTAVILPRGSNVQNGQISEDFTV